VNERQALQQLTHSQDLMRYIVGHARSAIAVHDRNLNYLYVSEEYLRTYDVESTDVIGRHHYEVFPDLPQKWRDVHQRALRGEISSAEDDPFDRASGERLWTRWECRPWYENDQSIGGIIINTEVTNRVQRLQKTLADNRNLLAVVMATVPDGLAVIDGHGRFLEVNEALPRMTGYDADELRAMSVWDLDELDSEEDANRRMMHIRSESHEGFDSRLKRSDGASVNVRVSVSLLESEPQSFLTVFRATDPA
jgi:PAS domain S-box-containing protein